MVAITKPTINGSNNTWGSELNTALDTLSAAVTTLETGTTTAPIPLNTITTRGDIVAGTGSNAVTRVHASADGQVLTANSAAAAGVTFATPPGSIAVKLRQTSGQSIPANAYTALTFQTTDVIRIGTFSSGSTTYTPGIAGWYELTGGFCITNGAAPNSGVRAVAWQVSGVFVPASVNTTLNNGNSLAESMNARNIMVQLSASDSISLCGYHNYSSALSSYVNQQYGSYMGVKYLGA